MRGMAFVTMLIATGTMFSCAGALSGENITSSSTSQPTEDTGPITLQLAVIADAKKTALLLTVKNISVSPVTIPAFMEKGNAVTVIEPGGTGGESFVIHGDQIEKVTLKPGESKSWEYDAGWHMSRAGVYTFSWRIEKWKTPEVVFIRKTDEPTRPAYKPPPVNTKP
ncbi:MAG: hypothetical protein HZA50_02885 [Planctomycetes bacterium]|nr:hypothetical protein [Planctomycetota bacterium]